MFGGDFKNEDGEILCHLPSAFDDVFSFDRNQEVWRKLGFNPFTQACLLDAKVKHQVAVLANRTIDIEVDPKLHMHTNETWNKNKDVVAKNLPVRWGGQVVTQEKNQRSTVLNARITKFYELRVQLHGISREQRSF